MKGDSFKNLNLTMESYNRQLIRNTNLYSRLITTVLKNAEKEIDILSKLPKDYTMVEVWKQAVDFEAMIDKSADYLMRITNNNANKVRTINVLKE